jgi:lipoprotein NlpD
VSLCRASLLVPMCVLAMLGACAGRPPAPIEDRSRPGISAVGSRYTVLRGDTLFAIAFRHGLDYRRLAAANAISVPYTIFPGQALLLAESEPARSPLSPPAGARARSVDASPGAVDRGGTSSAATAVAPTSATPTPKPKTQKKAVAAATPSTAAAMVNTPVGHWGWPVRGRIQRRFETSLHKGIDIVGARGDKVLATAGGRVAYAGSGIAGYGLMLIIRHNDEYLSAYGHADALLVEEGDAVRAGQTVALRGSSGTDSVKLHFEIRRQGRPVDPLKLLPAR